MTPVRALVVLAVLAGPAIAQEPEVKTVEFDAPSVGRKLKFNVVLPRSYDASPEKRFPVLYLLHGYTSNYTDWAKLGAGKAAQPFDLIVVMADGGNSWYVNWSKAEGDAKNAWEDCLVKDLIPHVDATYRTVAAREGRAISGLSMGGYGAMTVGLRHPEMFASVGSQSGAIGFARSAARRLRGDKEPGRTRREPTDVPNPAIGLPDFDSQAERTPKGQPFASAEEADGHDPFALVAKVPAEALPHLYLDCGTEDFLYEDNREFAKLLLDRKIPFAWAESRGDHSAPYWAREIYQSTAVQYLALKRAMARTAKASEGE